jgi:glycosyltransferase involved in cell wall biosynthesis
MRFHVLAIPHTVTNKDYVACAFTQKIIKFCKMMSLRGHEIIHYGHEDSEVSENVTVVYRDEYNKVFGNYDWHTEPFRYSIDNEVCKIFNERCIIEIGKRKRYGDFLLAWWGMGHKTICDAHQDMIVVEPGIGYAQSFAPFRVYESYAALHAHLGIDNVITACNINWYHAVIPNYFDPDDFEYQENKQDYFLFIGRIGPGKGVDTAINVTRQLGCRLVIGGQGGPGSLQLEHWPPHVEYVGYVDVEKRKTLMKNAKGFFLLSMFVEPFGGAAVESMFSGTPVITTDWGAFSETVLHGTTGFRCRTLDHIAWAARNIHTIDPKACREWAEKNYSLDRIADMYEEYFNMVHNVWYKSGWPFIDNSRSQLDWLNKFYPVSKPRIVKVEGDMNDHLHMLFDKVYKKEPFAIIRLNDGEYKLLNNEKFTNIDGWTSNKFTSEQLLQSISLAQTQENMYIGLPCKDCQCGNFNINSKNITYACIFCNGNWKATLCHLERVKSLVYYIGPGEKEWSVITERYTIGTRLVDDWSEKDLDPIIEWVGDRTGLFLFSMGPLAKILIPRIFQKYPSKQLIDIGSSIDPFVKHDFQARPYNTILDHEHTKQICSHTYGHEQKMPDITCILSVYRRPHLIYEQIKHIKAQTIPAVKIIVWISGCDVPENLPSDVTVIHTRDNFGVWGRFAIAQLATTKYVCVIDDDTMPGSRWFENCYATIRQVNGLLGTIGWRFSSKDEYTFTRRYGWDSPSDEIHQVDTVGHSWFFKTEWIHHLWAVTPDYSTMPNCGEDMSLSYAFQKAHINTYVPPHPPHNLEMFGSIPETAWRYGTDQNATSLCATEKFNRAYRHLREKGFKIMLDDSV